MRWWIIILVILIIMGIASAAQVGQFIYTDRLYDAGGNLIWDFAGKDIPTSSSTFIVTNETEVIARYANGTVLIKDADAKTVIQEAINSTS